ncbi:MAG: hypothetical protein ACOX60_00260 [Massiliimalia sp.]|jgi:hypothetical protein
MNQRQNYWEDKKWGIFSHYLANPAGNSVERVVTSEEWNRQIDEFQVSKLAEQISQTGADYFCITIGQNSGNYCTPNETYDRLTGITPSRCSQRDLVQELSEELAKYGIDLWVYLPSGAPCADAQAVEQLEWEDGMWDEQAGRFVCKRLENFQRKWESIIEEWSLRWGDGVKGWWIDGCYFAKDMYLHPEEPNFTSFARALRAGNKDAVICFNTGLDTPFLIPHEEGDFTAGEVGDVLPLTVDGDATTKGICEKLSGKKLHVLSYLGTFWGMGEPRFPDALAAGYTQYLIQKGGVITWDIRLNRDGSIPETFLRQLIEVGTAVSSM